MKLAEESGNIYTKVEKETYLSKVDYEAFIR